MKRKAILVAVTLVAFAAASGVAMAADDNTGIAKPATNDTVNSAPSAQKSPAKMKAKPHSHVQEKSGVAPSVSPAISAEEKTAKSKMHQHSKDAK
jgi:nitrate/TMAO reductase-like tetraheme cytochrome c subunit